MNSRLNPLEKISKESQKILQKILANTKTQFANHIKEARQDKLKVSLRKEYDAVYMDICMEVCVKLLLIDLVEMINTISIA